MADEEVEGGATPSGSGLSSLQDGAASVSAVPASIPSVCKSRKIIEGVLGEKLWELMPVGSLVTCNPPPIGTDEDWLALCFGPTESEMRANGFDQDGTPEFYTGNDAGGFRSWRRDDLNVVTTEDATFFGKFATATALAKRFNLLIKADRIALFQAVLYGVHTDNLEQRPYTTPVQGNQP